jgi:hypothetical protein
MLKLSVHIQTTWCYIPQDGNIHLAEIFDIKWKLLGTVLLWSSTVHKCGPPQANILLILPTDSKICIKDDNDRAVSAELACSLTHSRLKVV